MIVRTRPRQLLLGLIGAWALGNGSCGTCPGVQDACVDGSCGCQPDCAAKTCGSDGCSGQCGQCGDGTYCALGQTCASCQSAVCGVCDEIDTSTVTVFMGPTGEQQDGIQALGPHVFDWPITTELIIDYSNHAVHWSLDHLPGESWSTTATVSPTAQPSSPAGTASPMVVSPA